MVIIPSVTIIFFMTIVIINNLQIYYLTNGELVRDGSLDLGEKWLSISVNAGKAELPVIKYSMQQTVSSLKTCAR